MNLTMTSNCQEYRTVLGSEPLEPTSGPVTSMAVQPAFQNTLHFCQGTECLYIWMVENRREVFERLLKGKYK
jgi:hypothetical protein